MCAPWRPRALLYPWTPDQERCADAIAASRRVSIASANGVGKTILLADTVVSFAAAVDSCLVLTTAPTRHQLRDLLWPAIRARLMATGMDPKPAPGIAWTKGPRAIVGLATNAPERLQGFHHPHLLVAVDEASGLRVDLLAALEGIAVDPDNRIVCVGNPNSVDGALWRTTTDPNYTNLSVSALTHPNILTRTQQIPGATSWTAVCAGLRRWARETAEAGPDTFDLDVPAADVPLVFPCAAGPRHWLPADEFRVRFLGLWPRQPSASLCAPADIAACQALAVPAGAPRSAALDVARFGGDATVLAIRAGAAIVHLETLRALSVPDTVNAVLLRLAADPPSALTVDAAGLGAGHLDLLAATAPFPVRRFVGADPPASPHDARRFLNRRAAAYARLADRVRAHTVSLPPDAELAAELAAVTYHHDAFGRMIVDPKEQLRSALGRSTDAADAITMLFDVADPPVMPVRLPRAAPEEW